VLTGRLHSESEQSFSGLARKREVPVSRLIVQLLHIFHSTDDAVDGLPTAPYDGIAEVWVDDISAAAALFASDHCNTVIAADEANFLDRSKTVFLDANETVIVD